MQTEGRKDWDDYFADLARMAATRATCVRRQVGAVLVSTSKRVRATGFNGTPSKMPHCVDGGCPRGQSDIPSGSPNYDTCYAVHAEVNCLLEASPEARAGGSLYVTDAPCPNCSRIIANSGVAEVVVLGGLYDEWCSTKDFLLSAGVRVRMHSAAASAIVAA